MASLLKFKLEFVTWEDGARVAKTLTAPDRWAVHSAERVTVTLGHLTLAVVQQPTSLTAA